MKYIIGCSGFHYKHWKGDFYPGDLPENKWFGFYSEHFSTLELNVTFYRFPKLATLQHWYESAGKDYIFSVKVPRSITHFKKLNNSARMLGDFYGLVREGLREKLGSVLFQFPPNFSCNRKHLDRIITSLDASFENVVEFRHPSWWNQGAIDELGEHQIAFCGMSHPDFPDQLICNADHIYFRMHGRDQRYASDYSPAQLKDLARRLKEFPRIKRAYIYFNNDINGYATKNAKMLIDLLKE